MFNMVKPFLHPVTLDKISVFRFDKNEWSAALLKEIDADPLHLYLNSEMKIREVGNGFFYLLN